MTVGSRTCVAFGFLFREFVASLGQNRFLHLTYGTQVTISLLVLGVFFVLLVTADVPAAPVRRGDGVYVFREDNLAASQYVALEDQLGSTPHVVSVKYRSKERSPPSLSGSVIPQSGSAIC